MSLIASSKGTKSFGCINIAICVANGLKWLNFQCRKGRVLYINLEIIDSSFYKRVNEVYSQFENYEELEAFDIWNLRNHCTTIEELETELNRLTDYDLFIIDPVYKLNIGDENSASEQTKFFNHLDNIASENNTAVLVSHHHTKGPQSGKKAIDRASGSGVWGRAVDAMIDLTEVNCCPPLELAGAQGFVASFVVRDFVTPSPVGVWWNYPIHRIDKTGSIINSASDDVGSQTVNAKRAFYVNAIERVIAEKGECSQRDLVAETGKSTNTVKDWVSKLDGYEFAGVNSAGSPLIVRVSK